MIYKEVACDNRGDLIKTFVALDFCRIYKFNPCITLIVITEKKGARFWMLI
jgi:hypothetical protein